jgi:hypothetical protein
MPAARDLKRARPAEIAARAWTQFDEVAIVAQIGNVGSETDRYDSEHQCAQHHRRQARGSSTLLPGRKRSDHGNHCAVIDAGELCTGDKDNRRGNQAERGAAISRARQQHRTQQHYSDLVNRTVDVEGE